MITGIIELIRKYYLMPMGEKSNWFNFIPHEKSAITEIEIKNQVLSLYSGDSHFNNFMIEVKDSRLFDFYNVRTWFHNIWHSDLARQLEISHNHLHDENFEEIPPDKLKKLIEKMNEYHLRNSLCLDGKTNCFLTKNDQNQLMNDHKSFYKTQLEYPSETVYVQLHQLYRTTAYVFIHSFISTLFNNFLKPYLLYTKKISPFSVNVLGKTLEGLIDFICTPKALNAGIIFCLRESIKYTLQHVLPQSKMTNTITDMIASISSICGTIANPLNVINIGLSASGDTLGRLMAYKIIYLQPKLKHEPDAAPNTQAQVIREQSISAPGLRKICHS